MYVAVYFQQGHNMALVLMVNKGYDSSIVKVDYRQLLCKAKCKRFVTLETLIAVSTPEYLNRFRSGLL